MFSGFRPSCTSMFTQEMPAAPMPVVASFTSSIFLPVIAMAFSTAAPTMIAVPCWSSWNTGIFMRSRSLRSTMKHSGALMSSRLMPPKVGSSEAMMSTSLSGSFSSTSMSNTSMPANFWNSTPLPSITGLPASAPMLPRPSTAVPLEITATRLPRAVSSLACCGSALIASQAYATPGEYASDRSRWVSMGLVAETLILPGGDIRW
ncbi:hypothetical protein D3C73_770390 [compost metagenome]